MTDWKKVRDSRTEEPAALDTTSSATTVYERRNIRQETQTYETDGQTAEITEWAYEQREYTREEYTAAAANRDIMEALASIERAVSDLGGNGTGEAGEIAAAVERGLAL